MPNQAVSLMPNVNEQFVPVAMSGAWFSDDLLRRIGRHGQMFLPDGPEAVHAPS